MVISSITHELVFTINNGHINDTQDTIITITWWLTPRTKYFHLWIISLLS